jgi:hypothetical protein
VRQPTTETCSLGWFSDAVGRKGAWSERFGFYFVTMVSAYKVIGYISTQGAGNPEPRLPRDSKPVGFSASHSRISRRDRLVNSVIATAGIANRQPLDII